MNPLLVISNLKKQQILLNLLLRRLEERDQIDPPLYLLYENIMRDVEKSLRKLSTQKKEEF